MDSMDSDEQEVFDHFATVYPHETYANWPDQFWEFFHRKYPHIPREVMKRTLRETGQGQPR